MFCIIIFLIIGIILGIILTTKIEKKERNRIIKIIEDEKRYCFLGGKHPYLYDAQIEVLNEVIKKFKGEMI